MLFRFLDLVGSEASVTASDGSELEDGERSKDWLLPPPAAVVSVPEAVDGGDDDTTLASGFSSFSNAFSNFLAEALLSFFLWVACR